MTSSEELGSMLLRVSNLCRYISRTVDLSHVDKATHKFLSRYREELEGIDKYNSYGLVGYSTTNLGLHNRGILSTSMALGGSYPKWDARHWVSYREDNHQETQLYNKGSKVLSSSPSGIEFDFDNDVFMGEIIGNINQLMGVAGRLSNSVIFRHRFIDGRRISMINPKLEKRIREVIESEFKGYAKNFYKMYNSFHLSIGSNKDHVTGFVRGKSYIDHAKAHLGCRSAVSIDISKFYDNISLLNIVNNNLFYNSLLSSFEQETGLPFEASSFKDGYHYDLLSKMFGLMNVQFVGLMTFLTHNGLLPTGAHYSPNISNLLLSNIDLHMVDELKNINSNLKYTRYADDICISSDKDKDENGEYYLNMDFIKRLETIINNHGFHLNYDKTMIMGASDRKKIAGIILDHTANPPRLSIGSVKKLELKNRYDGKDWKELTTSDMGTINWVKTINRNQYEFVCSGITGERLMPVPRGCERDPVTGQIVDVVPF